MNIEKIVKKMPKLNVYGEIGKEYEKAIIEILKLDLEKGVELEVENISSFKTYFYKTKKFDSKTEKMKFRFIVNRKINNHSKPYITNPNQPLLESSEIKNKIEIWRIK